jgi:hypothetical protein
MKIPFTSSEQIARTIKRGDVVIMMKPNTPAPTGENIAYYAALYAEFGVVITRHTDGVSVLMVNHSTMRPTAEKRRVKWDDIFGHYPGK